MSSGIKYIHKKINSGLTNYNNNDNKYNNKIIKNNKIIVRSILENNDVNKISKINNSKSFMFKSSDKKFYIPKKNKDKNKTNSKLNIKKDDIIMERNNYSFLKVPNTINCNNIENINQNSSEMPNSGRGGKEKINVSEFGQNFNLNNRENNNL